MGDHRDQPCLSPGLVMDQEYVITVKKSNTDRWKGLAPLKDAYAILAGEVENDQD